MFVLKTLLLAVSLNCPEVKMHDRSGLGWTEEDKNALVQAQQMCPQYYPDAPCVHHFYKIKKQDYYVTCGAVKGDPV